MKNVKDALLIKNLPSYSLLKLLIDQISYRIPMQVTKIMIRPTSKGESGYYVCPRCGLTIEREFMSYCDRCGQHLSWEGFENAIYIYPGEKGE